MTRGGRLADRPLTVAVAVVIAAALAGGVALTLLPGCAVLKSHSPAVSVAYAGSLVDLMEHELGPAFAEKTGFPFQGVGKGSRILANEIRGKLRRADVFISAAADVDESLMGARNGDWVRWYVTFAEAPVVIGYSPKSRYAAEFRSLPWYKVLEEPGIRIGRTDPALDPKGKRAIELLDGAEKLYGEPGLARRVLGADDNPGQVFPEQDLLGRLQAGQLDAAFFYANEATEQGIPFVSPDPSIDPMARYTVTIVRNADNPEGALAFVKFLLGPDGRATLKRHGLRVLPPVLSGDGSSLPAGLRDLVKTGE